MNLQSWRRIPAPKSIIYVGEYIIMRWVIFFMTALPYNIATSLVRSFIKFGYAMNKRHKSIAIENILMTKPPVIATPDEATHLALRNFEYFALSFIHMLHMPRFIRLRNKKNIRFENIELLDKTFKQGKGAILVSAHFGNWEIGIAELALLGYPINFVAFQQINPYFNELINRTRKNCGVNVIPTKGAISKSQELLKQGKIIVMLIDQTGRDDGVEAEFFGRIAPAMWGAANLCLKTGAPIIPFGAYYQPDKTSTSTQSSIHYTVRFNDMINYQPISNKDKDIKMLTQAYLNEIEKIIRRAPEQWIWFHRRWKKYK
jgi:KDO2-lipid IV(A) lauroyltransferase